jgi:hypothetical protein
VRSREARLDAGEVTRAEGDPSGSEEWSIGGGEKGSKESGVADGWTTSSSVTHVPEHWEERCSEEGGVEGVHGVVS